MIDKPLPLFDSIEFHKEDKDFSNYSYFNQTDYNQAKQFLSCYVGSKGTYNAYRREVERLLHWSWQIAQKNLTELRREDIEKFIYFCQSPPIKWIGIKKSPRFIHKSGVRVANKHWTPFVVTVTKAEHRMGITPKVNNYSLSQAATKDCFAILSSFFNYLIQEEYAYMNPVALIRQKSQFIRKHQQGTHIRRLTDYQWQTLLSVTETMAEEVPEKHERSLFIITALYSMYLRISELCSDKNWTPMMHHFSRDGEDNWWFTVVGKGNKLRQIAVSHTMLNALKRWRAYLDLSSLPTPADNSPLLPKKNRKGPLSSTTYLRELVQTCFDKAIWQMKKEGKSEEADALLQVTVHWLRHTGISDDVKRRPREHVRDDAGHTSSATTDKYIDIELKARHDSAKEKPLFNAQVEVSEDDCQTTEDK